MNWRSKNSPVAVVTAFQLRRNRLHLDRLRFGEAGVVGGLEQRTRNPQRCETGEFRGVAAGQCVFVGQNNLLSRGSMAANINGGRAQPAVEKFDMERQGGRTVSSTRLRCRARRRHATGLFRRLTDLPERGKTDATSLICREGRNLPAQAPMGRIWRSSPAKARGIMLRCSKGSVASLGKVDDLPCHLFRQLHQLHHRVPVARGRDDAERAVDHRRQFRDAETFRRVERSTAMTTFGVPQCAANTGDPRRSDEGRGNY